MMYGREKSDSAIVAGKPTNKVVSATAEPVEPRAGGRGECEPAKHASDTVPKMRVTGAGAHTASSPSLIQGGSRVREFRSHGSVRGAVSNDRPYRDSDRANVFRSSLGADIGRFTSGVRGEHL
jgi:hypothetical protein